MRGADLKRLRERNQWSQADLANAINASLGRSYGTGTISPWETGKRNIPADVAAFLEALIVETNLADADDVGAIVNPPPTPAAADDEPPGLGATPPTPQRPLTSGSDVWTKACEELWELIGGGIGMVGGATGNHALVADGAIIVADKEALGKAWGKLAETNATFRKMLQGMTEGGAWLQVALVTGTTLSKCYSENHAPQLLAAHAATNGYVDAAAA